MGKLRIIGFIGSMLITPMLMQAQRLTDVEIPSKYILAVDEYRPARDDLITNEIW